MPKAWIVIHEVDFINFLRRAAGGEKPDLLFAEFYANCEVEAPDA